MRAGNAISRGLAALVLVAALGALAAAPAAGAPVRDQPYVNPVLPGDFPDPGTMRDGSLWWTATTTTSGAIPLFSSPDLVHWARQGNVLSRPPRWADGPDMWAPELVPWGDHVLALYSVRRHRGSFCLAVAVGATAAGPYADRGPLTCQRDGSIDPTVYPSWGTRRWLVWKEDGNSAGRPTRIWARRLRSDGLKLLGPKRLVFTARRRWQGGIVEAPELIRRHGMTYLFFSGGTCCQRHCSYAEGVARARWLLGHWEEDPADPILRGNRYWQCPGHASVVNLGDRWFVLYHAIRAGSRSLERPLLLDELRWDPRGWPTIDDGHGPSVRAVGPPPP